MRTSACGKVETDPFDRVEAYVRQRLVDDRHVWATVLFDEVTALGYDRSYQVASHEWCKRLWTQAP